MSLSDPPANTHVLLLLSNTLTVERWSGVHRVAVELARNLSRHVRFDIVKWDEQDGQLRFADRRDYDRIFGPGRWPGRSPLRATAHKVRYRFGDELDGDASYWLLNPEIGYHAPHGNEIFARVISQCREYGVRVASIFYDLIPVTNEHYREHAPPHLNYMGELYRCDVLIPISVWSSKELVSYYELIATDAPLTAIVPILLPELQTGNAVTQRGRGKGRADTIMMIGTVEPRKRQVEFLRAFIAARRVSKTVAALKIFVAGSLHPAVASEFRRLMAQLPRSEYADYAPDDRIAAEYDRALFSAFVSNDEGYGLPIAESLARGVPCLCANFGSMAEVAANGGCLTIDVNSPAALEAAIIRLAEDGKLRDRLNDEIGQRRFSDWSDYAANIAACLASVPLVDPAPVQVVEVSSDMMDRASAGDFHNWGLADVVSLHDEAAADEFIAQAGQHGTKPLLPSKLVNADEVNAAAEEIGRARARSMMIARRERGYRDVRLGLPIERQAINCFLRIVISTYNRGPFVRENVRWLLETVATFRSGVELVVVDNASTDDTLTLLGEFVGHSQFKLHVNTANVGMLGNLKVCSTITGAEYVWIIGDDDFIVPEQAGPIIAALREYAGIPLAMTNFGVYHRFALSPGDNAVGLIAEQTPLAPQSAPSGVVPLSIAGAQHDNLFTAIYPIIWRADVLAACFNYPFTGTPFGGLVESVPTTKLLLESYGATEIYWHAPIGIVGNAHNSWSRHRPRWHGRLMPEVFELARAAGINAEKLQSWSAIHVDLFFEAISIAHRAEVPLNLRPDELDVAWRVFRQRLDHALPPGSDPRLVTIS